MSKHMISHKVLQRSLLTMALAMAYGQAHSAATVSIEHADGQTHKLEGDHSDTIVKLSNGSGLEGSNVTLNGPGDNHDGTKFSIEAMVAVTDGSHFELSDSVISGTVTKNNFRLVSALDGSTVVLSNTNLVSSTGGEGSLSTAGLMVRSGAKATITDGSITTTGKNHRGLVATDDGTVEAVGVEVETSGQNSHAVALDAGKGSTKLSIDNATITTTGSNASGILVATVGGAEGLLQGAGNTISAAGTGAAVSGVGAVLGLTDSTITTTQGEAGVHVKEGGQVNLVGGSVVNQSTSGGSMGLLAEGAGTTATASGTTIQAHGEFVGTGELSNAVSAWDGAQVNLIGGSVEYLGVQFGRGILAGTGAMVSTNGTHVLSTGANSHAVHAYVSSGDAGKVDAPIIKLTGGSVTAEGDMSWGLYAQNGGRITSSADITTIGAGGFGVFADNGHGGGETKITLNGGSVKTSGGSNIHGHGSHGVISKHSGSLVEVNGTTVRVEGDHVEGEAAAALLTELGGVITVKDASIETAGTWNYGVHATGGGSIKMTGGKISSNNAKGKGSQDGVGSRAYAIYAKDDQSSIETQGTAIVTQGQRAYGAYATDGGKVELTGGSITTHGFMAYGVYASGAGSSVTTNGVDISTTGQVGDAIWAYKGGITTVNGGNILVRGEPNPKAPGELANGASVLGGIDGVGDGIININNASITTLGANSAGILAGASVGSDLTSGTANLNNTRVEVRGAGAVAASIENGSTLNARNGTSFVSLKGNGIETLNNASVSLAATSVEAAENSIRAGFSRAKQQQNVEVGSGSTLKKNNGTLLRVDRSGDGSDGVINMTLQSGSQASGNIRNYLDGKLVDNNPQLTNFVVNPGAIWTGIFINSNTAVIEDGAGDQNDFSTGEGEDVAIEGSGSGTQNFNGNTNIGGSVSVGRNVAFNGRTTIGSNLLGQDGTTVSVAGPANIGGSVTGGSGANFSFSSDTQIGGGVQGAGSNMTFGGATNIGGSVSGQSGSTFTFSTTDPTTIGGNVDLGDSSSIAGGSPGAPIQIGGNANAGEGATLGGNLHVAGSVSGRNATFAPGNSVGSQTYGSMGDFSGTYVAEINAVGQSDLVTITSGNADLTGIDLLVRQENGNGGYKLNHDYTIVKTGKADGISAVPGNKFASEALDESFSGTLVKLDPVKYGNDAVQVSLSFNQDAVDRNGYSSNQNATFDGLVSVLGQNTAADAVMLMQPDARKDALNQLSGELHGSTQAALLQNSSLVTRTLTQRMRGNLGAGMLPGAPTAQAGGTVAGAMPTSAAYPLWAQVVGNWSTLDDDGNAAKVKTNVAGLFIGGDAEVGAGWRVGGALGYTDGRVKVDDRNSKSDVSSFTAALYGGNSWDQGNGKLNFLVGAAYSHHDIDSRRQVNVGGNQTLKADYSAHSTQVFSELGYAMPVGQRSTVEPYVGVAWLNQKAKGFTEEGGPAALQGESQKDSITTFTLGLRGKTALDVGRHAAHIFAGLGWRHASGDVDPGRRVSFVQGGGTTFGVAGAPIAKNAAVVDLGVEMSVGRNTAMGLGYSGQFGDDNTDHSGQLFLRTRF